MAELPILNRDLVEARAGSQAPPGADGARTAAPAFPDPAHLDLPVRAVQFGTGAFLRGFVDAFLDEARRDGRWDGRIVAIGSTGSGRASLLNEQDGLFTLISRGLVDGEPVEERRVIGALKEALSSQDAWDDVLALARVPELELVFSNTTEAGLTLDTADAMELDPPRSFPGKLTAFLYERARHFDYDTGKAPVVIPCELVTDNGRILRDMVLALADAWGLEPAFVAWLDAVPFCDTLVDRIVPGAPEDEEAMARELGYRDALVTTCEPYRLFAIRGDGDLAARIPFADHPDVVVAPDIAPYRELKLRLLNGGHTSTVPLALLAGLETVGEAVADARVGAFLRTVLLREIAPHLAEGVADAGAADVSPDRARDYARQVLDRFANPYIRHALVDITLQCTLKMDVRVVPSIVRYTGATGEAPPYLALGFAGWLLWARGDLQAARRKAGLHQPPDDRGEWVAERWKDVGVGGRAGTGEAGSDAEGGTDEIPRSALASLVLDVCERDALWSVDLTGVPGFAETVTDHLVRLVDQGAAPALEALLEDHPPVEGGRP